MTMSVPQAGISSTRRSTTSPAVLDCWRASRTGLLRRKLRFDERIGAEGDVDLAMTVLTMPSGALAHINNSRACAYGFDQRVEVFGTKGMVQTSNQRDDPLIRWSAERTEVKAKLKHFFLERYDASFHHALDEFHRAVAEGRPPSASEHDGRAALAIALACDRSRREGVAVSPEY